MDSKEFEEIMKPMPAYIEAKCDEHCHMQMKSKGRGAEILALALGIADNICKQTDFPIDVFCQILKDKNDLIAKMNKKQQNDMEKIINTLLGGLENER